MIRRAWAWATISSVVFVILSCNKPASTESGQSGQKTSPGSLTVTMLEDAKESFESTREPTRTPYLEHDWTTSPTVTYNVKLARPLTVGMIRVDGSLVPFATFDGRAWRNHWPQPEYGQGSGLVIAPALVNIPPMWWGHHDPVLQWWVLKGRTLMSAIAVKGTSVVDSLCGSNVALATNFRADVPVEVQRGGAGPAGLALSALDSIVPIDRIESDSLEFPAIDKLVSPMFSKMESDIWKQDVKSEGHAQSPKLIAVHASNLPGSRRVFAFRAQRNLKALGTTSIVGWIYRDSTSKLTVGEVRGYQADPDGKGDTQLQPDAVFTVQGHTFWLGRTHGYEDSGYFVMEVGGPKTVMVLQVDAGGC